MSLAYQKKIDNLQKIYDDPILPLQSGHTMELFRDLHDLVSMLVGRIAQLEEQVTMLNQKMG